MTKQIIKEIAGNHMNTRVVPARSLDGELGKFEIMYEYSRTNNIWRYYTGQSEGLQTYKSLTTAARAAKRIAW